MFITWDDVWRGFCGKYRALNFLPKQFVLNTHDWKYFLKTRTKSISRRLFLTF